MEFRKLERGQVREQKEEEPKEIKEMVDKILEVYEKNTKPNSKEMEGVVTVTEFHKLIKEKTLPQIPEIQPNFLEKVLNGVVERYKGKEYLPLGLGFLFSLLINHTVERYIQTEKEKGKKFKEIKPLKLSLNTHDLLEPPDDLAFRNPEKCNLTVKGDVGVEFGTEMEGGEVRVEGNCEREVGIRMDGGRITIGGNCGGPVGKSMGGGEIIIEGYCEDTENAFRMRGGRLIFEGGVEGIDSSAFAPDNLGEIWIGRGEERERIWPIMITPDELKELRRR